MHEVVLRKRNGWTHTNRYDNVCLVLDGVDFLCLDYKSHSSRSTIVWNTGRVTVGQVRIDFRNNAVAMISELKIIHWNIENDYDEFKYQVQAQYHPTLPVIGSFDEKLIWIKITEKDAEKKAEEYGKPDYGRTTNGMWLDVVTKHASDDEIKRHREVLTTRHASDPDAELEFFDMLRYRSWDAHPESLKKNLDTNTYSYYFRYWWYLAHDDATDSSRGFWGYTNWYDTRMATFCMIRFKSATLQSVAPTEEPTTTPSTTTITTTMKPSTTTTITTGLQLSRALFENSFSR